jgi:hypothetical protein
LDEHNPPLVDFQPKGRGEQGVSDLLFADFPTVENRQRCLPLFCRQQQICQPSGNPLGKEVVVAGDDDNGWLKPPHAGVLIQLRKGATDIAENLGFPQKQQPSH